VPAPPLELQSVDLSGGGEDLLTEEEKRESSGGVKKPKLQEQVCFLLRLLFISF